uniref:Uncharacterized protein n=1 Tax=Parascaris equorum TaxID=6256 RepID=A0A914REP8_PAREQ
KVRFIDVIINCNYIQVIINCSYIQYGIDNTTILEQLSRNAFMSLRSESYIEPPLLTPEEKKARWLQRKLKKQQKTDKRGSVKLDCPRKVPNQLIRRVVKVKKCSCIALNVEQAETDEVLADQSVI